MKYQTSPRADFQNAVADAEFQPPNIEIDGKSLEFDYAGVEPISINRELLLRLVKT